MAHLHGKAGQFGKAQARRLFLKEFHWFALMVVTFAALFALAGYWWRAWKPAAMLVAIAPLTLALVGFWKLVERRMDRHSRERIKWMRGAQGEAMIAWTLQKGLDDRWHVFNDLLVQPGLNVDHVVVGPAGVFCLETKSNCGWYNNESDVPLLNGKPCDFASQSLRRAMTLRDRLGPLLEKDVPWVRAILVLPFGHVSGSTSWQEVWLRNANSIAESIDDGSIRGKLSGKQIERIVRALEAIRDTKPVE